MAAIPSIPDTELQVVCDIIGDTSSGLTGSTIGQLLARCEIDDPSPTITKRYRLFQALNTRQLRDGCANNVMAFIMRVFDPVRWVGRRSDFDELRGRLNQALAFSGYTVRDDGQVHRVSAVRTLSEAEARAGRLRLALLQREVHPDVLRFCQAELLQENYFHAVFEVTKSVADKIRERTGLTSDGTQLVDQAFAVGQHPMPVLAFNSLRSETERSEHNGLMNLIKGMFSAFRNVTAHTPKIRWEVSEQDAKDLLSLASLLHRRIDGSVRTSRDLCL